VLEDALTGGAAARHERGARRQHELRAGVRRALAAAQRLAGRGGAW
jgi:hypothetical protein